MRQNIVPQMHNLRYTKTDGDLQLFYDYTSASEIQGNRQLRSTILFKNI